MGGKTTKTMTLAAAFEEGAAHRRRGDWDQAERIFREIVKVKPDFAEAHNNLGVALKALGRLDEAVESYRRAVAVKPDYAEAHGNLGNSLRALDRAEEAVASYRDALAVAPDNAEARLKLGTTLAELGRHEEAVSCYREGLAIAPESVAGLVNLALALESLNRHQEAIESYLRALAIDPQHAGAHNCLGNALMALDRHEEAIESYRKALAIAPDLGVGHINLGGALQKLNRHREAIDRFRRTQEFKPDFAEAHWNEGLAALRLGDFKIGWAKYEYRWLRKAAAKRRSFGRPLWLGGDDFDLAGKTVLLHAEQGLGDTIQFVRFVPHLVQLGAAVVLEVQQSLAPLLAGSLDVLAPGHEDRVTVVGRGDPLPRFDVVCPLLSLPLALATTVSTIPAKVPYLKPSADRAAAWRARLPGRRRRVGIAWSGAAGHNDDRHRSMPFAALAPLLVRSDIDFHVLQNKVRDGEREAVEKTPGLIFPGEEVNGFAETAALTSLMDLVISVDTSIAHLAGALALPVWLLLPFSADWRWMTEREDSPWYPTARLFRQPAIGDWDAVVAGVVAAL